MKKTILFISILSLLLIVSCQSEPSIQYTYHVLPPENDTSYNLVKGGTNGQKRIQVGTNY